MTSNTEVSIGKWLDEVLASIFDIDDDSDYFSHLDSESEEEEDEGLAALSSVVSTEHLASSSSRRLCVVQFLDSAGALENRKTLHILAIATSSQLTFTVFPIYAVILLVVWFANGDAMVESSYFQG